MHLFLSVHQLPTELPDFVRLLLFGGGVKGRRCGDQTHGRAVNCKTIKINSLPNDRGRNVLSSFLGILCRGAEWVGDNGKVLCCPGAGLVGCDQWLSTVPVGRQ